MKMRISVTIENEDESAFTEATTREFSIPGVEAFIGPEVFDQVFEQYEREALEARNSVMKEASEKYVSEVGKKKTQSEAERQAGELIARPKEYSIEAEIGQLEIETYEIKKGSKKLFSTKRDVFPETGPREAHKSVCFRELALLYPCDESYRKSAEKINRALRRKEGQQVQARTLANLVEREGDQLAASIAKKAECLLEASGFHPNGAIKSQKKVFEVINEEEVRFPREQVCHMIEELNDGLIKEKQIDIAELHETFEDPSAIKANISIDDVCCKKQKAEGRKKGSPSKEKREMVNNTVVHIQNKESKVYTAVSPTVSQMMPIVLAFLLSNDLLSQPGSLVFFTDGARDLRKAIQDTFHFIPFKIILDWFHLKKKGKELLSMAISGKAVKNQILTELLAWLWLGKFERAIQLLREVSQESIKNYKELRNLINYLERNSSCIPCYALRNKLGLRTSSNPVEKANDLLVSHRQKQNGMSWSPDGSTSLATLTALCRNAEDHQWFLNQSIRFTFPDRKQVLPAA